MRVLITDGDTRQALAAARSLGRAGHVVVVVAERSPCLAGVSRGVTATVICPSTTVEPRGFAASVASIADRWSIDVVLPMTEISTALLTRERQLLPTACRLPFPGFEAVSLANNKAEVLQRANDVGIRVPETQIAHSPAEAEAFSDLPDFPIVVKPTCSRVLTPTGWLSNSVNYAADKDKLFGLLRRLPTESYPVLLQERIAGPGVGMFLLFDHGQVLAEFSHCRLREKPPSGGVSVLCESIPLDRRVADLAATLLTRMDWHGPAMIEFKRDLRDGSLRLMEINGRFWGSLQLAIDAGVDFPALLVDAACGRRPAAAPAYRTGVRSRWLGGDLDALMLTLLKARKRLNLPPGYPGRARSIWTFLQSWDGETRLEIERLNDPRPDVLEWRRRLGAVRNPV